MTTVTSEPEQTRVETKGATTHEKRPTLWEILNSQLMLWILGSLVLSGITAYWNHRNDDRAAASIKQQKDIDSQREDSQFLGTMLPYLTNSDLNVRLRAVEVITTRYPEGRMPDRVSRLTIKVIAPAAVGQSKQTEETKSLVANVARVLDRQQPADDAAVSADVAAAVQQLPPRVYLQIFQEDQRAKARDIQALLRTEGLLVPGIENVAAKANPVQGTQVRYFNDSDEAIAKKICELLIHERFPRTSVQKPPALKANPGTIEVWFGAS